MNVIDIEDYDANYLSSKPHFIYACMISNLVKEYALNDEQERAFRIIAQHVLCERRLSQLQMYIDGMIDTGKSRVIKCVIRFFELINERHKLIILAPTRTAAALIGGSTFHSFLEINARSLEDKELRLCNSASYDLLKRIRKIRYILIDEVSMISCQDLYNISAKLSLTRNEQCTTFDGINIIFAGDFDQLKPVRVASLYSSKYDTYIRFDMLEKVQESTLGKAL